MPKSICCFRTQDYTEKDADCLVSTPSKHLFNLATTYGADIEGMSQYAIREYFQYKGIPFRNKMCIMHSLTCCGSCTRKCTSRCVQDIINRVYLKCGNLINGSVSEEDAPYALVSLYHEFISKKPHIVTLRCMLEEIGLEEYIYAPVFDYEEKEVVAPNGFVDVRFKKKVDPETGEASILYWPTSGMCPYCLPNSMVDRRRISKR